MDTDKLKNEILEWWPCDEKPRDFSVGTLYPAYRVTLYTPKHVVAEPFILFLDYCLIYDDQGQAIGVAEIDENKNVSGVSVGRLNEAFGKALTQIGKVPGAEIRLCLDFGEKLLYVWIFFAPGDERNSIYIASTFPGEVWNEGERLTKKEFLLKREQSREKRSLLPQTPGCG